MLRVRDAGNGEESEVRAREVVNAAGLHAPAVAATMQGLPQRLVPRAYFARGHYFTLKGAPCSLQPWQKEWKRVLQAATALTVMDCQPACSF